MTCYICGIELNLEPMLTAENELTMGHYLIIVKNTPLLICSDCFRLWNKVIELLISRFKEQKYIDETICKKIIEYENEK